MKKSMAGGLVGLVLGMALTIQAPDTGHEQPRSTHWPTTRAVHLKIHPACEVCGSRDKVEVHHVVPFHLRPDLELDPENLITLCANPNCKSHLTLGHLGDYKKSNPDIREDAIYVGKRRKEAK